MAKENKISNIIKYITIAAFLAIIALPLCLQTFGVKTIDVKEFKKFDLRTPNSFPEKGTTMKDYPNAFTKWYDDFFVFRQQLNKAYRYILYTCFQQTANTQHMIAGKNGHLFLGNKYEKIIDSTRKKYIIPDVYLKAIHIHLSKIEKWLSRRGVKLYVFVAPNHHTIYRDYLPAWCNLSTKKTSYERFRDIISQDQKITFIDLQDLLLDARTKNTEDLYSKTDTHWNTKGAYIAYTKIMEEINKDYKRNPFLISPYKEYDFKYSLEEDKLISDVPIVHYHGTDTIHTTVNEKTVLIYRDSFFYQLAPFFNKTFGHLFYTLSTHMKDDNLGLVNKVKKLKSDIVVLEFSERSLVDLPSRLSSVTWNTATFDQEEAVLVWFILKDTSFFATGNNLKAFIRDKSISLENITVEDNSLKIETTKSNEYITFNLSKDLTPPDENTSIMNVDITSNVDSFVEIFYLTNTEKEFKTDNSIKLPVAKGTNNLFFEIPNNALTSVIKINFGPNPNTYTVNKIEAKPCPVDFTLDYPSLKKDIIY